MKQILSFILLTFALSSYAENQEIKLTGSDAQYFYERLTHIYPNPKHGNPWHRINEKTIGGITCTRTEKRSPISTIPGDKTPQRTSFISYKCTIPENLGQDDLQELYNALTIQDESQGIREDQQNLYTLASLKPLTKHYISKKVKKGNPKEADYSLHEGSAQLSIPSSSGKVQAYQYSLGKGKALTKFSFPAMASGCTKNDHFALLAFSHDARGIYQIVLKRYVQDYCEGAPTSQTISIPSSKLPFLKGGPLDRKLYVSAFVENVLQEEYKVDNKEEKK